MFCIFLIVLSAAILEAGRGAILYRLTGGLLVAPVVSLCEREGELSTESFRFERT